MASAMNKSQELWSSIRFLVIRDQGEHVSGLGGSRGGRVTWRSRCRFIGMIASSHLSLVIILILYSFAGAAVFEAVESHQEKEIRTDLKESRLIFLLSVWNQSHNGSVSWDQFEQYATQLLSIYESNLLDASKMGIYTTDGRNWDFWSAMFFCATVFTTVGYGNITPATTLGRWLTIVYAIIGIPLCLVVLADMGRLNTRVLQYLANKTYRACRRIKRRYGGGLSPRRRGVVKEVKAANRKFSVPPAGNAQVDCTNRLLALNSDSEQKMAQGGAGCGGGDKFDDGDETIHINFLLPLGVTVVYMLLGVFMYTRWETWDFTTAFYFIFVSFFTIGFGDIVPAHPRYFLASSIYVLFGLSLVATIVNVIMDMMNRTFTKAKDKAHRGLGLEQQAVEVVDEQRNVCLKIKAIGSPADSLPDSPKKITNSNNSYNG